MGQGKEFAMKSRGGIFIISVSLSLAVICSPSLSLADKLYLKSGRVVQGEVVEKEKDFIIFKEGDSTRRYYRDQISGIEETNTQAQLLKSLSIDLSDYSQISEEKVNFIVRLFQANGTLVTMDQQIKQVIQLVPTTEQEQIKNVLNSKEIIKRLVPVYDKYFSENELRELIAFYESPTGQKLLSTTSSLAKDVLQILMQYIKEKAQSPAGG